jgi:magnesium-transporting ATPase (P-type)
MYPMQMKDQEEREERKVSYSFSRDGEERRRRWIADFLALRLPSAVILRFLVSIEQSFVPFLDNAVSVYHYHCSMHAVVFHRLLQEERITGVNDRRSSAKRTRTRT